MIAEETGKCRVCVLELDGIMDHEDDDGVQVHGNGVRVYGEEYHNGGGGGGGGGDAHDDDDEDSVRVHHGNRNRVRVYQHDAVRVHEDIGVAVYDNDEEDSIRVCGDDSIGVKVHYGDSVRQHNDDENGVQSAAEDADLAPPSCTPPAVPHMDTRLGMMPPSSSSHSTPLSSSSFLPNDDNGIAPVASTEQPVTMVFLGYHSVDSPDERWRVLGGDAAVHAESGPD
ncbi:uncharacterized protein LOC130132846 [Lampris incognitus]|uniref:uncharacterized protein LOC130132846 n=1 Tax=Lampris incognitus TaxID=2546036 RepID=UPI0024B58F80|nr:uncharacterized protein LOC130132846 [Lampris incognitus]